MNKKECMKLLCKIIGFLILYFVLSSFLWNNRNPIDYYIRLIKGEYNTEIRSAEYVKGTPGMVIYCQGRYLYYDMEKNSICDCLSREKVISLKNDESEIFSHHDYQLFSNGMYVYWMAGNKLQQYNIDGKQIGEIILGDINYRGKLLGYAGEDYVYIYQCEDNEKYTIANVSNISQEVEMDYKMQKTNSDVSHLLGEKYIELKDARIYYNGNMKMTEENDGTIQIMNESSHEYSVLVAKETQESVNDIWKMYKKTALGEFDEKIYFADNVNDVIYQFDENNYDQIVKRISEYEFTKYKMQGDYLIVLNELYSNDSEIKAQGSIGEFRKAKIIYYNLKDNCMEKIYELKKEQPVYISEKEYATFKDGKIHFYKKGEKNPFFIEKMEGYVAFEVEDYTTYYIEECQDKLFVFCEDELVDCVDIPEAK